MTAQVHDLDEARARRAGKDAVGRALAAGLPGSVAILAGSAFEAAALGMAQFDWLLERHVSMQSNGMQAADATRVLETAAARLATAEVWPWR